MGNEGFDWGHTHIPGVAFVMKENEPFCPLDIGAFSAIGVVLGSKGVTNLVEQLFRGWEGWTLRLKGGGVWSCHIGFEQCIIMKIFLINHQLGGNKDIITILFPINRPTRVFSGLYASYKRFAWTICG